MGEGGGGYGQGGTLPCMQMEFWCQLVFLIFLGFLLWFFCLKSHGSCWAWKNEIFPLQWGVKCFFLLSFNGNIFVEARGLMTWSFQEWRTLNQRTTFTEILPRAMFLLASTTSARLPTSVSLATPTTMPSLYKIRWVVLLIPHWHLNDQLLSTMRNWIPWFKHHPWVFSVISCSYYLHMQKPLQKLWSRCIFGSLSANVEIVLLLNWEWLTEKIPIVFVFENHGWQSCVF